MTRHDLREVVLVEVDVDEDLGTGLGSGTDAAAPGGPAGPRRGRTGTGARRGWTGIGRRRAAVVGVVLALLVATGVVVEGARERALAARLDGVTGLLTPLGPQVGELWRVPAGWGQLATIGGDLVIGRQGAAGGDELVGIDTATGAEQWVAPIPELDDGEIWCESFGDAERHVTSALACRIASQGRQVLGRRTDAPASEGALLLVIDTRTGERVAQRRLTSRYPTLESVGDDLVVVELADDGHVLATRTDPVTGTERWSFRSADPLPETGRLRQTPVPLLQRGVLLLTGSTGWALSLEGELLGEWDLRGASLPLIGGGPGPETLSVLPDGRFAVARPGAGTARSGRYGTVTSGDRPGGGASATGGFAIPGPLVQAEVDDGSADGVVLTEQPVDGVLTAQDATTGALLWDRDTGIRGDPLVLDGRLLAVSGDSVVALEPRTGDVLWTVPLEGRRASRLLTDGRLVMAGSREGDRRVLLAWGVDDGRERWRAALPPDAEALLVVGGRLLAFSEDHVIALGLPARPGATVDPTAGVAGARAGPAPGGRLP